MTVTEIILSLFILIIFICDVVLISLNKKLSKEITRSLLLQERLAANNQKLYQENQAIKLENKALKAEIGKVKAVFEPSEFIGGGDEGRRVN